MTVPLLDLKAQYRSIKPEIDSAVARVFESQRFINGPEVEACERDVAAKETLAMPVYPELTELQQGQVVGTLRKLLT